MQMMTQAATGMEVMEAGKMEVAGDQMMGKSQFSDACSCRTLALLCMCLRVPTSTHKDA